ncbi:hypothetical protein F4804DRAFT_138153 [Jackrogersella minutella]|nr:hypothetical protein F4804DRAFT_138153 [Jackrogersella minutella]
MVRDGIDKISKIEFLSIIQNVQIQAFKEDTIRSGSQKNGIYPFNPLVVLRKLEERATKATTAPTPILSSSPIGTPVTLRQMHRVGARVGASMETSSVITPKAARDINRIVKASISNPAKLIQTKRDLGRTRYAERIRKQRRAVNNTPLESGGVLTVADGRAMVKQREDNLLEKARRMMEAAELNLKNDHKKWYFEAAKKARKWRTIGKPDPEVVYQTGKKCKYLKRF